MSNSSGTKALHENRQRVDVSGNDVDIKKGCMGFVQVCLTRLYNEMGLTKT
ncbi:hypothetical protein [Emticicia sp. 17c]|uniref:hypothetical protein n=1 Tax=Emticicia sp. 17c TaxID=3127704 RepID=UPI00301CE38F